MYLFIGVIILEVCYFSLDWLFAIKLVICKTIHKSTKGVQVAGKLKHFNCRDHEDSLRHHWALAAFFPQYLVEIWIYVLNI